MTATVYLTAAVVGFLVYKLYSLYQVPKSIQHLPEISFISLLKSSIMGRSHNDQYEMVYKPVLDKLGYARLWLFGNWEIIISDPKQAQEVLKKTDAFSKIRKDQEPFSPNLLIGKFVGSNNLFFSDGDDWRRHRRVVNPAFKKTFGSELFGNCTLELIKKISETDEEPIIAHDLFRKLTLDFLGFGLFSYNFEALKKGESSHYFKVYSEVMSAAYDTMFVLFPFLENWVPSRRYYHSKNDEFQEFLRDIIKERQNEFKQGVEKDDLLSLIIKSSMEEKEESAKLTDAEVISNIASLFLAGHDSTANTFTATFYYLAKHQDIQDKARQEILELLGNKDSVVIPTSEQAKSLNYLNCIIKESMRILPTLSEMCRYSTADIVLSNGLTVPAGFCVRINSWGVHHNSNIFSDPDVFNPDRFLESHNEQDQAWLGFGSGSRMCAGVNFSMIGQRVAIAMLLQKFRVTLGPNYNSMDKPYIKSTIMLYPKDMDVCFTQII